MGVRSSVVEYRIADPVVTGSIPVVPLYYIYYINYINVCLCGLMDKASPS